MVRRRTDRGPGHALAVALTMALVGAGCTSTGDGNSPDGGEPPASIDAADSLDPGDRALFVRGSSGSGGFLADGADDQLSDVFDASQAPGNSGWATFADQLRRQGLHVDQVIEGRGAQPAELTAEMLDRYQVIVLGSNNADYSTDAVTSVVGWVRRGGGLLAISDANWGTSWDDAAASDNTFLSAFDLRMNQDHGRYVVTSERFPEPAHPLLHGVTSFEGEGVSPLTVVDDLPDVEPVIVARAAGDVRRPALGRGPLTPATAADAALVAVEYGDGRVVGFFDRNTFFNRNGAGTDITHHDNRRLADNIVGWLTGATGLTR